MTTSSTLGNTLRALADDALNDRKQLALKASVACWAGARALDRAAAKLVKATVK